MKTYRYRGYAFRATTIICANNGKPLYEIDGLKCCGSRPFLTSVRECREFIDREREQE